MSASETPTDALRAFYERHPYPPPLRNLDQHRELYRHPDRRRALSLLLWPTEPQRTNRQILVAGCGTSQAAIHAMREPDAHVTGIDISETSLCCTRDLQEKYDLRNLDLHRLAIEDVGVLGQVFDEIVCTGVLHHLPDPDAGLRGLRGVLAQDGALHVMVYAAYGRAGIYMMQEYCRLLGVRAREAELSDLGAVIGEEPKWRTRGPFLSLMAPKVSSGCLSKGYTRLSDPSRTSSTLCLPGAQTRKRMPSPSGQAPNVGRQFIVRYS